MKSDVIRRRAGAICLAVCAVPAMNVSAQQAPLSGHVKVQQQYLSAAADSLSASLGYREFQATNLDLRVIGHLSAGRFGFDADYLLLAAAGKAVELQSLIRTAVPRLVVDRAAMQWLPLDDTLRDDAGTRATQSLDRFSVSYTTNQWVFKLGRQAYSWANGIVFRPLDLFDPFAPDAVDESYKPGIDAVYVQRLLAGGADVSALIVPRRDPVTGRLSNAQSSAALKWHGSAGGLQIDLIAAHDYGDGVLGLGLSGSWGQAVWRLSVLPVRLAGGGTRTSLVANLEHAWLWGDRNVSGFVEYFRNGFGRADRAYAWDQLEADLIARLARGQLFNTGRDYAAGGLRLQLTPLLDVDPVLLVNLHDRSVLLLVQGSYSIAQNLTLDFGVRAGAGGRGTEFGGLPTTRNGAVLDAPPTRIYARLAHYF